MECILFYLIHFVNMKDYCVHVNFFGRVQGVGFRFLCLRKANSLGVKGWVRNSWETNSVEAVFFGEKKIVLELIEIMKHGAYWIRTDNVVVEEIKSSEVFTNFQVRY